MSFLTLTRAHARAGIFGVHKKDSFLAFNATCFKSSYRLSFLRVICVDKNANVAF
jgi:hypothetical protein